MRLTYLGFAVLPQLYPLDNLKALLMLQLPCCNCCLPSFRGHAEHDHLKVFGGMCAA